MRKATRKSQNVLCRRKRANIFSKPVEILFLPLLKSPVVIRADPLHSYRKHLMDCALLWSNIQHVQHQTVCLESVLYTQIHFSLRASWNDVSEIIAVFVHCIFHTWKPTEGEKCRKEKASINALQLYFLGLLGLSAAFRYSG